MTADEPSLQDLWRDARDSIPDPLRGVIERIIRTLELHDERLTNIEDTQEIKQLLP